jgi:hypothetical protein
MLFEIGHDVPLLRVSREAGKALFLIDEGMFTMGLSVHAGSAGLTHRVTRQNVHTEIKISKRNVDLPRATV